MSLQHLHKRFTDEQIRAILAKQAAGQISPQEVMRYLAIGRTRLHHLRIAYAEQPNDFSLARARTASNNRIDPAIEANILKELRVEKEMIIDNPDVPTTQYNYSYIRDLLEKNYNQKVSVPTIIARAKAHGYWKERPSRKKHDREVITHYIGELTQHDSSHHLFAPFAKEKWYLITSLDDYSRLLLYADFWSTETTWAHIMALQSAFTSYGFPFSIYADSHSIFRYVRSRDKKSSWITQTKFTDEVDPQWKQVVKECGVKPIYALSPQAKGKIERPYRWLQDRMVRTCLRENVTTIERGRELLHAEVAAYNTQRVHSTTGEIPIRRFEQALDAQQSLYRAFRIPEPFTSSKDLFALRIVRRVNTYHKVSLKGYELPVPEATPGKEIELRLYPDLASGVTDVRCWDSGRFLGEQHVKNADLGFVHF